MSSLADPAAARNRRIVAGVVLLGAAVVLGSLLAMGVLDILYGIIHGPRQEQLIPWHTWFFQDVVPFLSFHQVTCTLVSITLCVVFATIVDIWRKDGCSRRKAIFLSIAAMLLHVGFGIWYWWKEFSLAGSIRADRDEV